MSKNLKKKQNSTAVPSKTNAHGRANKPHDNITVREKAVLQKADVAKLYE